MDIRAVDKGSHQDTVWILEKSEENRGYHIWVSYQVINQVINNGNSQVSFIRTQHMV